MLKNLGNRDTAVDVLIVGASPVGLCHALRLTERERDVLVIDAEPSAKRRDEWLILEPDTLGLLESVGLAHQHRKGLARIERAEVEDASGRCTELRLDRLQTKYPYLAVLRRSQLETALEQLATEHGIPIERHQRLQSLQLEETSCRASVEVLTKVSAGYAVSTMQAVVERVRDVHSQVVIGADGRRSIVRRDLKAAFLEVGEPRFQIVVEFTGEAGPRDAARIIVSDESTDCLLPVGPSRTLWVSELVESRARQLVNIDEQLDLSVDTIQTGSVSERFLDRAQSLGFTLREVTSQHAVRFQPRRAVPPGRERIWLSGAAAQVLGPVLGQDENLGLREARDLALMLGADGNGASGLPLLTVEQYEQRRLTLGQQALGNDDTAGSWGERYGWSERTARQVLAHLPLLGREREQLLGPPTRRGITEKEVGSEAKPAG